MYCWCFGRTTHPTHPTGAEESPCLQLIVCEREYSHLIVWPSDLVSLVDLGFRDRFGDGVYHWLSWPLQSLNPKEVSLSDNSPSTPLALLFHYLDFHLIFAHEAVNQSVDLHVDVNLGGRWSARGRTTRVATGNSKVAKRQAILLSFVLAWYRPILWPNLRFENLVS